MTRENKGINELAEKFGYLPYMIERYFQFLGKDETIELLKANERPLVPSIRVNTLKINKNELKTRLEEKGIKLQPIKGVPNGFKVIETNLNLGSLHEFLQGFFYIQKVASMLPPIMLDPKPNETVVDMCAAPGSKATQMAQLMKNEGNLMLIERNRNRIPALEMNIRRLGIRNTMIINDDAKNLTKLNLNADKILLDAPCTGEGLIRDDITRKTSKTEDDINKMAAIQRKLLSAGLDALKPGGKLLYCTCSIAPEENEIVVNHVLKNKTKFSILKINDSFGVDGLTHVFGNDLMDDLKLSQRIYPHVHDTIGFFFCLIKKLN